MSATPIRCEACGEPFELGVGCPPAVVAAFGWPPRTYAYGTEPDMPGPAPDRCRSCGVAWLEQHHVGCVVAVCWVHDAQAFGGCECSS